MLSRNIYHPAKQRSCDPDAQSRPIDAYSRTPAQPKRSILVGDNSPVRAGVTTEPTHPKSAASTKVATTKSLRILFSGDVFAYFLKALNGKERSLPQAQVWDLADFKHIREIGIQLSIEMLWTENNGYLGIGDSYCTPSLTWRWLVELGSLHNFVGWNLVNPYRRSLLSFSSDTRTHMHIATGPVLAVNKSSKISALRVCVGYIWRFLT